jgi:hypothetical protein
MRKVNVFCWTVVLAIVAASPSLAEVVEIGAMKDNTLYEDATGTQSNGAGAYFFAGFTAIPEIRRGLIAFDVAGAVPAGSTIDNVALTLNMSRTIVGLEPVTLHRALADWGEGASDAPGQEGIGTYPDTGDATWLHTFFPNDFWMTPGGDYDPVASASQDVGGNGPYTWSSAAMVADVQAWLNNPAGNYGWFVVGNEATFPTAKRFDTRENPNDALRPVLMIEFTPATGVPAASGTGLVVTALLLLALGTVTYVRSRSAQVDG